MSITPEKTKRLSIICQKGTKTSYPENRNKTDNDIFGLRRLKSKANVERFEKTKIIVEANMDNEMRSISPYFNGQKNKNYVAPHFNSSVNFASFSDSKNHQKNISTTPTASNKKTRYNIFNQEVEEEKKPLQKTLDNIDPPFFGNRNVSTKATQRKMNNLTSNSFDMHDDVKLSNDNKREISNECGNMVCDYCVNGKIKMKRIEKKEKEIKEEYETMKKLEESRKNEDNLKSLKDKIIKDRIKQRENLSNFVSNRITNGREKEKNKLQAQNEKDTFILHDREKVNNDILIANQKTKQKEVIQEGYLNKYAFKTVRPEITEYYDKYVENTTITDDEGDKTKNKEKYVSYREGLSKQVMMKRELNEKAKTIDYNTNLEIEQYTKQKEKTKENVEKMKQNQMKEQFFKENEKLKENKKREQEIGKMQKLNEAKKLEQVKKEISENSEKEVVDRKKKNKILMHELDKQINEKMKKRTNLSIVPDREDNVLIKGPDKCLISCGECNKKFPKKVMNKSNKYLKVLSK